MKISTEGYNAYFDGKHRIEDNYYAKGSKQRKWWNKGYLEAYLEDIALCHPEKPGNNHVHPVSSSNIFIDCTLQDIKELEEEARIANEKGDINWPN